MSAMAVGGYKPMNLGPAFPCVEKYSFIEPAFYEHVVQHIWNHKLFTHLGDGKFFNKEAKATFDAPGWRYGYDEEDVAHTPSMCRSGIWILGYQ